MDKKSLRHTQQTVSPSTGNLSNKDLPFQSENKQSRQQFIQPLSQPLLSESQPYNPPQWEQQPPAQFVLHRSRGRFRLLGMIVSILIVGVGVGVLALRAQSHNWTTIETFQGSRNQKILTFVVSNPWKIIGTCQGFNDGSGINRVLAVAVYNSKGIVNHSAIEMTCKAGSKPTTTSTEERYTGSVYLDVTTTGTWTIQIQEMK
jgi:hypothetical protein